MNMFMMNMMNNIMYYLYLLQCENDTIYTGITTDLERRFVEHKSGTGKGANYTRAFKPIKILYTEEFQNRSDASKRESEIKKMTRSQKLELVNKS